ncbi:STAS-like domain-containing protein [Methylocaldum sp. MU1018]
MTAEFVSSLSVPLVRFAGPVTKALETEGQAEHVIAALRRCPRRRIDLDFSGLADVTEAFGDAFFRLVERELPETWLAPRHYDRLCPRLVRGLVSRLEQLREKSWVRGCEFLTIGCDPQGSGRPR